MCLPYINASCRAVYESRPMIGLLSKPSVDHHRVYSLDTFIRETLWRERYNINPRYYTRRSNEKEQKLKKK